MENINKSSSHLNRMFDHARNEEPVMSMSEVKDVLEKGSLFKGKKKDSKFFWFGIFFFVGLAGFGSFFIFNQASKNSGETNDASVQTTTSVQANKDLSMQSASNENVSGAETKNELMASTEKPNESVATNNSPVEKIETEGNLSAKGINKIKIPAKKSESDPHLVRKFFEGDATINFSSGTTKVNMTVASTDEVHELTVNAQRIPHEKYNDYKDLIAEGLRIKKQNEKADEASGSSTEERKANNAERDLMNAMVKKLTDDKLITANQDFDFTLTGQDLLLNHIKQPREIFENYKAVYEKTIGEKLPANYNLHIKR